MAEDTTDNLSVPFPEPEDNKAEVVKPESTKKADVEPAEKKASSPEPAPKPKAPKPEKQKVSEKKKKKEKVRKPGFAKKITLAVIALVIILAGVGSAVYYFYLMDRSVDVTATMVLRGEIRDLVNATGKVEASQMTPVVALKNDKITEILVKEGDTVNAGQVLVKMETGDTVTSPQAGRVVNIEVSVGDKVVGISQPVTIPGSPAVPATPTTPAIPSTPATTTFSTTTGVTPTTLMTVANMDPTYLVADVDETDISRLKVGQKAEMTLDAYPSKIVKGEVVEIGLVAAATQTGGTAFPTKIRVSETKGVDLRIGMSADTEIIVETKQDALRIPVTSVVTEDGKDIAYVVKSGKAERTILKVGLLSGDYYEVLAGITEGDEVVIKGMDKLKGKDKTEVKVKRK